MISECPVPSVLYMGEPCAHVCVVVSVVDGSSCTNAEDALLIPLCALQVSALVWMPQLHERCVME